MTSNDRLAGQASVARDDVVTKTTTTSPDLSTPEPGDTVTTTKTTATDRVTTTPAARAPRAPRVRGENDGSGRDWTNRPTLRDIGLLLVRLYALTMILHGVHKLAIFNQFSESLKQYPISSSAPQLFTILVSLGMIILPLFIALGFLTRYAAAILSVLMFIIWMIVHVMAAKNGGLISAQTGGLNGESAILWVALMLPLVFTGAGRFSLDQKLGRKRVLAAVDDDETVAV